jgi:Polysaccharide biosynthesis/export protein/SLBB domain
MKKLAIALLLTACAVSALADALPQYGAIATGIGIDRTGTPISMQGSAGGDDREEVRRRAVDNCKIQETKYGVKKSVCKVVTEFSDGGCGYVTTGANTKGVTWGTGPSNAGALAKCSQGGEYKCEKPQGLCTALPVAKEEPKEELKVEPKAEPKWPTPDETRRAIESTKGSHRLQAGEKIQVTVFGEASLSGDYQIDPSGDLLPPVAGTVKAAGLTEAELEQELSKKFRSEYLRNPKVTVSFQEFRPFYILGEIEKPGAYSYTSGLNVLSAVAIAGGATSRASKSTVLIQHYGESGMREYPLASNVPILPGDIIRIPTDF